MLMKAGFNYSSLFTGGEGGEGGEGRADWTYGALNQVFLTTRFNYAQAYSERESGKDGGEEIIILYEIPIVKLLEFKIMTGRFKRDELDKMLKQQIEKRRRLENDTQHKYHNEGGDVFNYPVFCFDDLMEALRSIGTTELTVSAAIPNSYIRHIYKKEEDDSWKNIGDQYMKGLRFKRSLNLEEKKIGNNLCRKKELVMSKKIKMKKKWRELSGPTFSRSQMPDTCGLDDQNNGLRPHAFCLKQRKAQWQVPVAEAAGEALLGEGVAGGAEAASMEEVAVLGSKIGRIIGFLWKTLGTAANAYEGLKEIKDIYENELNIYFKKIDAGKQDFTPEEGEQFVSSLGRLMSACGEFSEQFNVKKALPAISEFCHKIMGYFDKGRKNFKDEPSGYFALSEKMRKSN
jgi:hypothetical protein